MSKCDLAIRFDRPDRLYSSGEMVTGTAFVRVNKDVKCNGLSISGLWRTHGRGNRATDQYYTQILTSGQWTAGQEYQFRFEVPAPHHPLTYRGTYLNIDHYLKLRVDIPWAFDPKLEEEFLLAPGGENQYVQHIDALKVAGESASGRRVIFSVLGFVLLVLAPFFFFVHFVIGIISLIVGAILLAANLRRVLAERLVGPVELRDLDRQLVPNTTSRGELIFTPRKSKIINEVSVELQGNEVCVSGSGSNKTTHRHQLWKSKTLLANNLEIQSGVPVRIPLSIEIPATTAYTVKLGENEIQWKAVFHIDIPGWPDWVHNETVQVIPDPAGAFRNNAIESPVDATIALQGTTVPIPAAIPVASIATEEAIPAPSLRNDLADVARQLQECDRFNDETSKVVDTLATELFQIEVLVDRINPTHGYFDDARYEDGQTVMGTIKGTDTVISVQLPRDYNEQLESVGHGQIWNGQGVIIKWDALYERLEMMGF